ncbi:DNA alkylation repair protein [Flavobacterium nackdongense]|uniref:DNA alkylation repair protein n=1 Tax=Flavobacterium nackdongense TaxID=2547394 RepID=A0A4V1AGE0_9FLAO|nr:DNA alkylation repair protein [Flavobacterium nackdongense]QBN17712.1 DNA alkylation repair protein [Flavobacterium nackdongense]
MNFTTQLESAFKEKANPENAFAMAKYMRNHFTFFGIKTEQRRQIFKDIWMVYKNEIADNPRTIALELYTKKERELHYCAIEILVKQLKGNYKKEDIHLIEKLILINSWWDSVDTIAKYILGQYLVEFPSETVRVIKRFSDSENIWLNRSAILFQLSYKLKTNFDGLQSECEKHKNSREFFIQKAIGWALREYGKSNPKAVQEYVTNTNLKPLSTKEALRNIILD